MRIPAATWIVLLSIAALFSLGLAFRDQAADPPVKGMPGAGVWLETLGVQATDEAASLRRLARVPENARWATVKNGSGVTLYLGTRGNVSAEDGWPVGPGEEVSFLLEAPVYLKSPSGEIPVRVLFGR